MHAEMDAFRPRLRLSEVMRPLSGLANQWPCLFLLLTLQLTAWGQQDPRQILAQNFDKALAAREEGELEIAESHYRLNLGTALDQLGDINFRLGEFDVAERAYKEALQETPFFEPLLVDLGYTHLFQGRYREGISAVESLLDLAPSSANIASESQDLGQIRETLPLASLQAPARHLLAKLFLMTRQTQKAATELNKVRALDSGDSDALLTLASTYLRQQQEAQAREIFDRMESTLGDSYLLRRRMGKALQEAGYLKEAVQELQRARQLAPNFALTHYDLGLTYLLQGKIEKGVTALRAALELNPQQATTCFLLGFCYELLGARAKAVLFFNNALVIDSDQSLAHLFLGLLRYRTQDFRKAIPRLGKAVSLLGQQDPLKPDSDVETQELTAAAHYLYGQSLVASSPQTSGEGKRHLDTARRLMENSEAANSQVEEFPVPMATQFDLKTLRKMIQRILTPLVLHRRRLSREESEKERVLSNAYRSLTSRAYRCLALVNLRRGDFETALRQFERAVAWDESLPDLEHHLARTRLLASKQRGAKAFIVFLVAGAQSQSTLKRARMAYLNGEYVLAEEMLKRWLASQPDDVSAHSLLGTLLAAQHRLEEAEKVLGHCLKLDSHHAEAVLNLSTVYLSQGRFQEALEALQQGQKTLPEESSLPLRLASLFGKLGRSKEALGYLTQVSSQGAPRSYFEILADLHASAGRFADAAESYREYLKGHPQSAATLYRLSQLARRQRKPAESLSFATRARKLAPYSIPILLETAFASMARGISDPAIVVLKRLRLMDPDNPDYLFPLGQALSQRRDSDELKEAIRCYQRLVELRPQSSQGHGFLGYCAFLIKDYGLARKHLSLSLKLDANQTAPYFYQGMIAYELGDDAKARELLHRVLEKQPNHGMARLGMGRLLVRSQQYRQALVELERAAELLPNRSEIHYQLSLTYRQLGEMDKSRQALRRYQELKRQGS